MDQDAYLAHLLDTIDGLYTGLRSKKTSLSVEAYKALLNDYYLKHFGFDRRTGKMTTQDYITKTYCQQNPFPLDKCLLLACFLLEDVTLSQEDVAEQKRLLKKVQFIDSMITRHHPNLVYEPFKKELSLWTAKVQEQE